MHRLRRQTGQTAAEYLGILVLVAVITGVLAASSIGPQILGAVKEKICEIGGGTACTGSQDRAEHRPDDDYEPRPPDSGRAPREVSDAECSEGSGNPVGDNDDPPQDGEAAQVYGNLGQTYDYFADTFGRESFDDADGTLLATINLCEGGAPVQNAYWDGERMKFGEGYGQSLDITAHELTHAITERTAGLEYECQSGALNEAMSDIFASNVDPANWEIGEDLPGGAIRDMEHPENGDPPQPGHVNDYVDIENDGTPASDYGGVHYNSGIINRQYVLMVQSMGRDAAQRVVYRALTEYLKPDSDFKDYRSALLASAGDLYGADSPERRSADVTLNAVGITNDWTPPEQLGCG